MSSIIAFFSNLFRFDNHVSIGHLLSIVTLASSGIWWAADFRQDMESALEKQAFINSQFEKADERTERHISEQLNDIKVTLRDIAQDLKTKADKGEK